MESFGEIFKRHPYIIIGAVILGALWIYFAFSGSGGETSGQQQANATEANSVATLNANTQLQTAQLAANVQNAQTGAAVAINANNNSTASQMNEQDITGTLQYQTGELAAQNSAQTFANQQSAIAASLELNQIANNTYLTALGINPAAIGALNTDNYGSTSAGSSTSNYGPPANTLQLDTWGVGGETSGTIVPFETLTAQGYTPPTGANAQSLVDYLATNGSVTPDTANNLQAYSIPNSSVQYWGPSTGPTEKANPT